MAEEILQPEAVETPEQPIAQNEEVETAIDADELEALRKQSAELEELQAKLTADKQREEILSQASKSKIRGFDKLYEFLDVSKIETDEGKQALFELLETPGLFSRQIPIGQPTNGSSQQDRSADALLAEAAAKARATGRHEDMVAYTQLKRQLKK